MKRLVLLFAFFFGLGPMPHQPVAGYTGAQKRGARPPKSKPKPKAKPRRVAPRPRVHRPAKVKPKSPRHAKHAPAKSNNRRVKLKKTIPTPKRVVGRPKVKPKSHGKTEGHFRKQEQARGKAKDAANKARLNAAQRAKYDRDLHRDPERKHRLESENRSLARRRDRLVERNRAWSRHSLHERNWSRRHWYTHRFAAFAAVGASGAAYSFDSRWWNNYVVNNGSASWSGEGRSAGSDSAQPSAPEPIPGRDAQAPSQPVQSPPAPSPPAPVVSIDQPFPLSARGEALARLLDDLQVESHWLPGQSVDWRTGTPTNPGESGPASNCGAFVAAACDRLGAPLPAEDAADFLPSNQMDWFMSVGKTRGWVKVGEVEAQALADQGWTVVASWKNLAPAAEREVGGQTAVVRPDPGASSELAARGPRIATAGLVNRNDATVKDGFPPGAWDGQQVVYLAHRPRD